MENQYPNLIKPEENGDIGLAISKLIDDKIKNMDTSFLAKVVSINRNKVSVIKALKRKQTDATVTVNNCLVGFHYSENWTIQHKLKVGDYGIAIVVQDDISGFKSTGKTGLNKTGRYKDINDSIFIPLSLYNTLSNNDINYLIKNHNESCIFQFDNNENGLLQSKNQTIKTTNDLAKIELTESGLVKMQGQLLTLQSETTSLKAKLGELIDILNSAMIVQSPSGIQPFDGTTKGTFSSWKTSLNDLFQE